MCMCFDIKPEIRVKCLASKGNSFSFATKDGMGWFHNPFNNHSNKEQFIFVKPIVKE